MAAAGCIEGKSPRRTGRGSMKVSTSRTNRNFDFARHVRHAGVHREALTNKQNEKNTDDQIILLYPIPDKERISKVARTNGHCVGNKLLLLLFRPI